MKLWELIVELERLEQEGKRDYEIRTDYGGTIRRLLFNEIEIYEDQKIIILG